MHRSAQALLEWYVEAGVTESSTPHPKNWFDHHLHKEASATPASEPVVAETIVPNQPPAPATHHAQLNIIPPASSAVTAQVAAIAKASALASSASTLAQLEEAIRSFDGCSLKQTATNTVLYDGNPASKFLLIGEAPGAEEDKQGIPFCGPSGALLDKMLAAIGIDRSRCLITNTLYWRPPGNRQPSSEEVAMCRPFVEKFIHIIDPALIVLVGGTAAKGVLGTDTGVTRMRGKKYEYTHPESGKAYPATVLFHPSYLLRQPSHKRLAWHDLQMIAEWFKHLNIPS